MCLIQSAGAPDLRWSRTLKDVLQRSWVRKKFLTLQGMRQIQCAKLWGLLQIVRGTSLGLLQLLILLSKIRTLHSPHIRIKKGPLSNNNLTSLYGTVYPTRGPSGSRTGLPYDTWDLRSTTAGLGCRQFQCAGRREWVNTCRSHWNAQPATPGSRATLGSTHMYLR